MRPFISMGDWIAIVVLLSGMLAGGVSAAIYVASTLVLHAQSIKEHGDELAYRRTRDDVWRIEISKTLSELGSDVAVVKSRVLNLRGEVTGPDNPALN